MLSYFFLLWCTYFLYACLLACFFLLFLLMRPFGYNSCFLAYSTRYDPCGLFFGCFVFYVFPTFSYWFNFQIFLIRSLFAFYCLAFTFGKSSFLNPLSFLFLGFNYFQFDFLLQPLFYFSPALSLFVFNSDGF